MKDTRPSLLLAIAVILLILSLTLLGTWAYYSHKNDTRVLSAAAGNTIPHGPPIPASPAAQDSLQYMYAATIRELDMQADSTQKNIDSLKSHMDNKLIESSRLRSEISALMKSGGMSTDEVAMARQKILALQQKVEELKRINQGVDEENRRLKLLLANLTNQQQANNNGFATAQYKPSAEAATVTGEAVAVSELRLKAIQVNNEKEQETTDAQQAEKIVGSFIAKGNGNTSGDLVVVVMQPDGRVLQNSTWDAGTFETREGKRVYSVKMRYDQSKNEARPYLFSISAERFQKGSYTMQIYQNGVMIARTVKTLS